MLLNMQHLININIINSNYLKYCPILISQPSRVLGTEYSGISLPRRYYWKSQYFYQHDRFM